MQSMHGIDVTTLRNTLARPGGGYFSPGLKQRLEPKAWCLLVSFRPLAHYFGKACYVSERDKPQAVEEEGEEYPQIMS